MSNKTYGKKYPCNQCLKRFSVWSNLNVHMETHTYGEKYPCNQWLKWLSDRSFLNVHMGAHTCGGKISLQPMSKTIFG